ncbi:hypothetical protein AAFF_G00403290 [Aldrovandia affinis]|uniref:Uncharacterized protein n=1 Tax=Aldrovandia affinis TaxID=143900 RepID=A0AAD7T7I5_9TELE|nr:hypothetical protein AAFF_G00403290 [Aldrovandia affinis]
MGDGLNLEPKPGGSDCSGSGQGKGNMRATLGNSAHRCTARATMSWDRSRAYSSRTGSTARAPSGPESEPISVFVAGADHGASSRC